MENMQGRAGKIQAVPKYIQLKNIIMEDIRSGKYPPNSKLPSETELMKRYNVSYATVYRTKIELANEKVIYTLQGKGCYVTGPEDGGREQKEIKSRKILLMVTTVAHEIITATLNGIISVTQNNGYDLELCSSDRNYEKETRLITDCLKKPTAGLIIHPSYYGRNYNHLLQLRKSGVPVVLINRYIKNRDFDCVMGDDLKGARDAVNYLIKMGHRRILFLGDLNYNESSEAIERLEGYKQALKENDLRICPELILAEKNDKDKYADRVAAGYGKTKKAISEGLGFTAVFAHNDDMAVSAYNALKQSGIKVPDEVSIVGFVGITTAEFFDVPITTVAIDKYQIGLNAARLLLTRINANLFRNPDIKPGVPFNLRLAPKLVIRKSVKKI